MTYIFFWRQALFTTKITIQKTPGEQLRGDPPPFPSTQPISYYKYASVRVKLFQLSNMETDIVFINFLITRKARNQDGVALWTLRARHEKVFTIAMSRLFSDGIFHF